MIIIIPKWEDMLVLLMQWRVDGSLRSRRKGRGGVDGVHAEIVIKFEILFSVLSRFRGNWLGEGAQDECEQEGRA